MSKLQNNYTTPEQSKRLLELGVPADSADMAYRALNVKCYSTDICGWRTCPNVLFIAKPDWSKHEWYPCWSVGQLIGIIKICCTDDNVKDEIAIEVMYSNKNSAQLIIEMKSEYAYVIDFSKLED